MIGPSSSHTAGAARIGYTAQKLLGDVPAEADIGLYGSFATTGRGHGTDRALVAGLLGLRPDDPRLPDSFALAEEAGMKFTIHPVELRAAHPNTTVLTDVYKRQVYPHAGQHPADGLPCVHRRGHHHQPDQQMCIRDRYDSSL